MYRDMYRAHRTKIQTRIRTAAVVVLALSTVALVLLILHQAVLPLIALLWPFLETPFYDMAVYGACPTQEYVSFEFRSPEPSILRWDESCDNGYVLVSPIGNSVEDSGPTILDARGNLVWMSTEFGTTMNFKVQRYQGVDYLTFWSGKKEGGQGRGAYYMLDSKYNIFRRVGPAGEGNAGDLHEFKITDQGTGLMTVYNVTSADLSCMGKAEDGWITDSVFQEVDIESGELIFEWRPSEHFNPCDSYYWGPFDGGSREKPFDFFHLNSVDKDSQGNYLVSSRHFHSIINISPEGEILWVLGGPENQFQDLSGGEATEFMWQHDARWVSEEDGILSIFDNGGAGPLQSSAAFSKGRIIQLDIESRTATLVQDFVSLQRTLSASQGSLQVLPENDHVFVGWGSAAAYTEFNKAGDLLCETHIGASWLFWFERVKSYRAIKVANWIGTPEYPPEAKIYGDHLYVSWNGATEVAYWELQGTKVGRYLPVSEGFQTVDVISKESFEENFKLPTSEVYSKYRVAALDKDQNVLRISDIVTDPSAKPHNLGWMLRDPLVFLR